MSGENGEETNEPATLTLINVLGEMALQMKRLVRENMRLAYVVNELTNAAPELDEKQRSLVAQCRQMVAADRGRRAAFGDVVADLAEDLPLEPLFEEDG